MASGAEPNAADSKAADLTRLSLEELMNVEVTLVSKKTEKLSQSPAAIYVMGQEEIRRSGATSIPELLRAVPGLDVARGDAHDWAVSARGFNDGFANKLLVMIDGRSVYTPLFSGVFWELQDTMFEDLDRIEVIRGPGAALWGANAVNGVINVTSKSARETQGLLVSGGGGTEERDFAAMRYGVKLGESTWMRVYGKYFDRDNSVTPAGANANDTMRKGQGGFRLDWEPSMAQALTLQGDFYGGNARQIYVTAMPAPPFAKTVRDDYSFYGGNVLGRWTRTFSEEADLRLQAYYDRTSRNTAIFKEDRDTIDVDLQQRFSLGERQEWLVGAGYRLAHDDLGNTYTLSFNPAQSTTQLISAFLQDQISLVPDRLRLTVGARFEHNDYTGFEVQPSARLLWTPTERQSVWAAISRAVRTPSRAEEDIHLNQPGPLPGTLVALSGSRAFESEALVAYETGYRAQVGSKMSVDVALFYNDYNNLRTREPGALIPGVPTIIPFTLGNNMEGQTYGIEAGPQFQLADWWRLQIKYTFLKMDLRLKPGSRDTTSVGTAGNSPRQQAALQSAMNFGADVDFDATLRYVDRLTNLGIPSYVSLGLRVAWRPRKNLELSLVGESLLDNQRPEFLPTLIGSRATEMERSVYGKVTWHF